MARHGSLDAGRQAGPELVVHGSQPHAAHRQRQPGQAEQGSPDNWAEATGAILAGGAHLPDLRGFDDGVQAQVTRSAAEKGSTDAEQLFYCAIVGARSRIWLTTAYFAPRRAFVDALCQAVERGVDVRVLTNGPYIDKQVVRQAGRYSYQRLLDSFRDPGLVAALEKHFLQDLEDACELDAEAWRARPLPARARELGGALVRREL